MIPEPATREKEEKPVVPIKAGSRDIRPHVANLVIEGLKDISPTWWGEIKQMLNSKSTSDRKFAISEINKLQVKSMPSQINADEGLSISVNIVNYGKNDNNSPQFRASPIPGPVIEGDG